MYFSLIIIVFSLINAPGAYLFLKLKDAALIRERHIKEGSAYSKERRIIYMNVQTSSLSSSK